MINLTRLLLNKRGVSGAFSKGRISCLAVWNITKRCNLSCKHCYVSARRVDTEDKLSTKEAKSLIDSLTKINTSVLLFSGGEPLLRQDIFELIAYANSKGISPVLSSNGVLISPSVAKRLRSVGIIYVGISIDGEKKVHDGFRGMRCFNQALEGLRNCQDAGIPVGVRFTLNKFNFTSLPKVIDLVIKEDIPRFCLYHLVYSGRARRGMDIEKERRRKVIDYLIKVAEHTHPEQLEILTVDNPCDGIYLYKYITAKNPEKGGAVLEELQFGHGRCSAGARIISISSQGSVFSCQFWNHKSLGNVRRKSLYDIWYSSSLFLRKLRSKEVYLKGKCRICEFRSFCGGCRLRAGNVYSDIWQEDPSCYLTREEVSHGVPFGKGATPKKKQKFKEIDKRYLLKCR
jgi:radical SAM protein with 4Fe4S-binding SPASM domain